SFGVEGPSDSFNLAGLLGIVEAHFQKKCLLIKISEGGSNKARLLCGASRVPAFPCDKLRPEVATLQHIASYTSVPVLAVYEWSADASSNQAGAEYMI
ncbi:hypothetical protein B0H14DRAFT_2209711, partial [Mycena olivaceomarginata]